ncbi:GT4 family glycosyltransferase PelF [Plantactinospora siamensis]|uniref:GT4 family glycosyltransferase PelF n=1 Tax=Plantactinospora siamensis TaxID=555372 RepID=A0ABV6P694_9ACTN
MRIALVSEGTYPYALGGVSVWCDQLIRGMPEHRWEMVALVVDGTETEIYERPDNLAAVRPVPLWEARRGGGRTRPDPCFPAIYRPFVEQFLAPLPPDGAAAARLGRRFSSALRSLYEYGRAHDLGTALTSNAALSVLTDVWRSLRTERYDGRLTLADAVDTANLIEHMLRPLSARPVEADVLHAAMNGLSILPGLVAKWHGGTPLVLSEHGIYLRERYLAELGAGVTQPVKVALLGFFRALASAAYATADVIAPHSRYNRRWQLRNGADPGRLWTMYNGVDPAIFPVAGTEPAEPTIVFMGRIDPLKDLHTLIRAFAEVVRQLPDARLRIFGNVPQENLDYRDACLDLIGQLGLAGRAVLEGRIEQPLDAYRSGHIVALTSISEGFPFTVIESMACGRPVVCTDVGGVAEAVGDAGIVVPARDVPAIAAACVTLLTDHDQRARRATAARSRVLEHFTLARWNDEYRQLYDKLAGAGTVE